MYDRHNIITKFLELIFTACFILVLSACSSNNNDTVATAETATEIPQFIQKLALTDGNLVAWITIDGGEPILMDLAGGTASASIPNLSRSVHTVEIKFEFTDGVGTITLATATGTVDLSSGDGSLSFADTDYKIDYDDDNDGDTNLEEVINGTSPLDCLLDTSVIDSCTLG